MAGNRDLSNTEFGIIANNADDQGHAEEGVECANVIHHVGKYVWDIFRGTGATLTGQAVIDFDESDSQNNDDQRAKKLGAVVESAKKGADAVEQALNEGKTVLSIGGNHVRGFDMIGAMRYCHEQGIELGLIWVDAHPDLNTPETSPSGNIHGMVSAVLTGRGPKELLDLLKGAPFLKPENIIYVGLNAIDDQDDLAYTERSYLEELKRGGVGVKAFEMDRVKNKEDEDKMPQAVLDAVTELGQRLEEKGGKLWLEFDVDVLRVEDMPAAVMDNEDGMRVKQAYHLCKTIGETAPLLGMGFTELSPYKDPDKVGAEIVARLIAHANGINHPVYEELSVLDPETVNVFTRDDSRKIINLGDRRIYAKPGCEYIRSGREHYVVKEGKVIEVKRRRDIPDLALGTKVQIHPNAVPRFGVQEGKIIKIVLPDTEGRTDDILTIEFDGGYKYNHKISEIKVAA